MPAEELERLSEVIGDALHECRQIARSTSGFVRESGGFEQSLTELAARVCRTAPLEIEVDWDPAIDSGLDGPHSHELFRIVQESLNNVVRHARATRVTIVGRADQAVCEVRVEDDGVGLEDAPRGAGVGLRIMEYRAGLFGARVAVRARRPRGTCVTVTWPRRSAAAGGLVFGQPGREQHRETT